MFQNVEVERRAFMADVVRLAGSIAAAEFLLIGISRAPAGAAFVAHGGPPGAANKESCTMTRASDTNELGKSECEELVRRYIDAEGNRDWMTIEAILDEDLRFRGGGKEIGKAPYLAVLKRLGLVWNGNHIKRIFVDGNEACALYDFLSDTPTGAVPCVEWIRFRGHKISEINFLFEREKWGVVEEEMMRRAQPGASQ